nr:CoA transferase [Halomonas sp. BC04]
MGVSIGDSLSALYAVIGTLLALQERARSGLGQVIDVALYESVFAMMESLLPEYDASGEIRQPAAAPCPGSPPPMPIAVETATMCSLPATATASSSA